MLFFEWIFIFKFFQLISAILDPPFLIDLTLVNIVFTDESVIKQSTDSISENLTDSDLESSNRWRPDLENMMDQEAIRNPKNPISPLLLWISTSVCFLDEKHFF